MEMETSTICLKSCHLYANALYNLGIPEELTSPLFYRTGLEKNKLIFLNKNKKLMFYLKSKFNAITYILEKFFSCSVHLELSRLKYPFSDSNMLAQIIALNGKRKNFISILNKLFLKAKIFNPKKSLVEVSFTPKKKNSLVDVM